VASLQRFERLCARPGFLWFRVSGLTVIINKFRALSLYEDSLTKRKRVLGDEHPDTLPSLNNLALLFDSKVENNCTLLLSAAV
jgi:hypothetical protein